LEDQLIPEASSFKYLGIITRSYLNCADHVNYTLRKARQALHFVIRILKKINNNNNNNNNTKCLTYTALVRPILEYGAVCWDPYRGQVCASNRLQKRAAEFANNTRINESGWETLAQRKLIARICDLFKGDTGRRAWKAIGNRLLKLCYLSRDDHIRKIRTRKQRPDVGIYSFVNRTIKNWNQYKKLRFLSIRIILNHNTAACNLSFIREIHSCSV